MISQIIEILLYASMTIVFFVVDKHYQFSTALLRRHQGPARRQPFRR